MERSEEEEARGTIVTLKGCFYVHVQERGLGDL